MRGSRGGGVGTGQVQLTGGNCGNKIHIRIWARVP